MRYVKWMRRNWALVRLLVHYLIFPPTSSASLCRDVTLIESSIDCPTTGRNELHWPTGLLAAGREMMVKMNGKMRCGGPWLKIDWWGGGRRKKKPNKFASGGENAEQDRNSIRDVDVLKVLKRTQRVPTCRNSILRCLLFHSPIYVIPFSKNGCRVATNEWSFHKMSNKKTAGETLLPLNESKLFVGFCPFVCCRSTSPSACSTYGRGTRIV